MTKNKVRKSTSYFKKLFRWRRKPHWQGFYADSLRYVWTFQHYKSENKSISQGIPAGIIRLYDLVSEQPWPQRMWLLGKGLQIIICELISLYENIYAWIPHFDVINDVIYIVDANLNHWSYGTHWKPLLTKNEKSWCNKK